jgi:lysophospholipase L1-like esterase
LLLIFNHVIPTSFGETSRVRKMATAHRRLKRWLVLLQTVWSILGITLILLGLTEAGFRLAFALKDRFSIQPQPDRRVLAEGYGGESWPVRHYREIESLRERWEPYVYFRPDAFRGETISIGLDGLRATWQPPSAGSPAGKDEKTVDILMLGGSSLWGFGARDDQTIPSMVAREFFERKRNVRIRNLAEIGYVSTQEVVALVREIQSGYRPDVVIFYDGVNDTTSALLEREAGLTTNEINRRREFNLLQSPSRLAGAFLVKVVEDSGSYRFAQAVNRRFARGDDRIRQAVPDSARARLAVEVVQRYVANVEIVERLGREYAFHALFYWQPLVFTKRALTPPEREEVARFAWAEPMFRDVLRRVREPSILGSHPAFHDLTGIFDDTDSLVFIDYCHTTESADARIAKMIANDVTRLLHSFRSETRNPEEASGRPRSRSVN